MAEPVRPLCLAILAHANRDCLADLVGNARTFCPAADIVVFNGGHDPDLTAGLEVLTCPYSEPLVWGHLQLFQYAILRWLWETRRPYELIVSVDSDMLLIKPGLERCLPALMAGADYMAFEFEVVPPDTRALNGRRYHFKWRSQWQPLFGTPHPYRCFNPGQVFSWRYVERLMAFEGLPRLVELMRRSRIPILEEMIYPTLAVALDCAPRRHPATALGAVRDYQRHTPAEIEGYLAEPSVHWIHPVAMTLDAPERRLVRDLAAGLAVRVDDYRPLWATYRPPARRRLRRWLHPLTSPLKDLYLRAARA